MTLREKIASWLLGKEALAKVASRVDDSTGWGSPSELRHDYDRSTIEKLYSDALLAWRKNPIAYRIISITTDFVVGEKITIQSPYKVLNDYIRRFWHHPKNRMAYRLNSMCDELSRAGDLFIALFRNDQDGMHYIRFVTKDQIKKINTAPKDWETELSYEESELIEDPRVWLSPHHPDSLNTSAVMLHHSINRPIGALLGESDLTTMLPWLQRYSRMLEDRVRLHWAIRAFLWIVTVPPDKLKEKREQYKTPPDSGSVIVKDSTETWEPVSPTLRGADAQHDLMAVRSMVDAGSGYPAHWRGEAGGANRATAQAMQDPTEKHLLRRQAYFCHILCDILYHSYQRAAAIGKAPPLPTDDYEKLFTVTTSDLSTTDNERLARSARGLARAFQSIAEELPGPSTQLARLMMQMCFEFAGKPQSDETLDAIMQEAKANQESIWQSLKDQYGATE